MRIVTRFLVLALTALMLPATQASARERLCDPSFENCRTYLIELIRAERVGLDVAFWFMEDSRYTTEIIRRWRAGVPVRVIVDTQANALYPANVARLRELKDAGIPMREKSTGGVLHWKTMIFAGKNVVEFSGANYSPNAFAPNRPYVDYIDEIIYFTDEAELVNSFKTKFDDLWTATSGVADYANITSPVARTHPTFPIHPDLNFPPGSSAVDFATRSTKLYDKETVGIDSIMYRITDRRYPDALIRARGRNVPVRLLSEPLQYREPRYLWHSWSIDRMYMAGVQIRHRAHQGLNHEKLTMIQGQGITVLGSSNWVNASANSQPEHNYFTTKQWILDWSRAHFERKWNNSLGFAESKPFVPLPPDAPVTVAPASGASNQPLQIELKWHAGYWAHKYDVYFGETANPPLVAQDLELGPSETATDYVKWAVPMTLEMGKTYYWKVVSKTMANLSKAGTVSSFRTMGDPPIAGEGDVVLYAWKAPVRVGNWAPVVDVTAAGGNRMANPNLSGAKVAAPVAQPPHYFEMSFFAEAGVPYRLWLRGKAEKNLYYNDSVYVQFSDSVTSAGAAAQRIGSTSGFSVTIEGCNSCGLSNWGWNDTAVGTGVLGPQVYFEAPGVHTVRVQVREDGLSIDQIVLSRGKFASVAPGEAKNDGTILIESGGSSGSPAGGSTEIVMHAAHAMQVRGKWNFVADPSAASGYGLRNPNINATKPANASVAPADYFEIAFYAQAGIPYHLWLRAQAEGNSANNDSVFVQFTGSLDTAGLPAYRVGSTSSLQFALQNGTGAGLSGWGWNDSGYDTPGLNVMFETTGWHTIRVQRREDGVIVDQIVLSPAAYLTTSPGLPRSDTTILLTSSPNHQQPGAAPPPPPPPPPSIPPLPPPA